MSKEVTSLKQKDNRERKAGKAKDKGMSFNELFLKKSLTFDCQILKRISRVLTIKVHISVISSAL